MNCDKGDIVFVDYYNYPDGRSGEYHFFVVIEIDYNELTLVPIEYLGFILSSQKSKENCRNENFPYNEPIIPNEINRLPKRSHVKCDELFSLNPNSVIMKLGQITISQYERFIELYKQSLNDV